MASSISAGTTSSTALVATADTTGALVLQTNNGTTALTLSTAQNATFAGTITANTIGSASATALTVQSAGTTAVTVDTSQNVGIGTTSPSGKLDVRGASYFGTPNTFIIGDDGGANGAFFNETASVPMRFLTAGTERMRIDGSGVFSFRCTSQLIRGGETYRFQTSGGIASFETSNKDYPVVALRNTGTNGYMMAFNNASAEIGTISSSGSNVSYNTSSDYRLKNNVAPMTGALAKVAALKPVTYKWIADGADGEGFIAHELAEVVPGCVTGEKDAMDADGNPVYQGIDTSFLVATLTAAIQELTAKVTALEAQVGASA